ncbi:formate dehydrogenase subunit delta [Rhizobium herbae]|jgi:formate dehydrogenase subunit delta
MSLDNTNGKLVRMANQIATFFKSQPENERVQGVATHINKFWEPRMRKAFFELVEQGDAGFDPIVISAAAIIKRPGSPAQPSEAAEHVDTAMLEAGFSD